MRTQREHAAAFRSHVRQRNVTTFEEEVAMTLSRGLIVLYFFLSANVNF